MCRLTEEAAFQAVVNLLRLISNPHDDDALLHTLDTTLPMRAGIGNKIRSALEACVGQPGSVLRNGQWVTQVQSSTGEWIAASPSLWEFVEFWLAHGELPTRSRNALRKFRDWTAKYVPLGRVLCCTLP